LSGALEGIKVADFSRVVAGPYAAMLLGDLGAEVVKVERPPAGDDTRSYGPPFVEVDGVAESSYYLSVNRNKRSVCWDLTTAKGRRHGFELAVRSDVVIENFKPGGAAKLGIGYDAVAAENPKVVYCSVAGIGSSAAGAALPGYDFLAQALSGLMSVTGDGREQGSGPLKVGVAAVDVLTSLFASNAILAALFERSSSGKGQHVEVDLLSSSLAALFNQVSTYVTTGTVPRAMGNRHPSIAPYETLMAADRPIVVAAGNDRQFAALAGALGLERLVSSGFGTNAQRVGRRDELVAELEAVLSTRPAAEWVRQLQERGVPCGVVNDIAEAFALAEEVGLAPVVSVARDDASGAGVKAHRASLSDPAAQVASPMRLSRTPVTYRLPPPHFGEHSDQVEAELDR
jgi:crotonobetainyl-CoA:carnitine CoA-transferase CaiB-like acyl-CoA transferase